MDQERWNQINALLGRVLSCSVEERAAVLDAADAAVRAEVEALLAAEADAPALLEEDAAAIASPLLADEEWAEDSPGAATGERIGPYRLVERIGSGGMSVVYRAERADGHFDQQVALKLLPRHFETEGRIARFRAERQILADLDHPTIARLLDGGVTETGRPYLAMEYVDGQPLTTYCAERSLPIDDRLRLLRTVCAAVQHAHRRLVVHRDLKPSNILVTPAGEVKLLDFGIAKLLDEGTAPVTVPHTRTGEHLMTPEYAAPEQIHGEAITTATDVYQLGVLAYELLAGRRPFAVESRHLTEIERAILEQTPASLPAAARQEKRDPPTLRRLRGDLDVIVRKAMRKERERRYPSVEALADDLERHLDGRPVTAQPATVGYRMRKFVRRHQWGVSVAAAFLAVLIGALALVMEQRDAARREAEKAQQVSQFLLHLFEASDPDTAQGEAITAATLLEQGRRRVEALHDQPAVQAQMMSVMGQVYLSLGRYKQADTLLRRAAEHHRVAYGPLDARTLETENDLANVWYRQGTYAEADSLLRDVLARSRRAQLDAQTSITLNDLGNVAHNQSNFEEAEAYHREALALRRALYPPEHEGIAASLNNIGRALHSQGRRDAAESFYRDALALNHELYGPRHSETTITQRNLGQLLVELERFAEADSLLRAVLAADRHRLDSDHPRIAEDLNEIATLAARREEYDAAARAFRKALAVQRTRLGPRHPRIALSLNNLAYVLERQDQPDSARTLKREALAMARETLGNDHVNTAMYAQNLAVALHRAGQLQAAESLYREALQTLRRKLPADHRFIARSLVELGKLLNDTGRAEAACPLLEESLAIRAKVQPADPAFIARAQVERGICLTAQGQYEAAEPLLAQGYNTLQKEHGTTHRHTQRAARHLADLYAAQGQVAQAQEYRARIEN